MGIHVNVPRLAILGAIAVAVIAALERYIQSGPGGSLLLTLSFWMAVTEGAIALMAAAQITHASWHRPIMRRMLSASAMLPILGLLFLVFTTQMDMYPWSGQSLRGDAFLPFHWMNKEFFVARGVVMILLVFIVARRFTTLALRDERGNRVWAVLYVLLFVIHLTMIGFEWVMSLEKPWFSTLFGAWWMVGGLLSGICIAALILYSWRARFDEPLRYAQKSIGGLMFGLSTFWAYFYFSQLIVIWYGNLPEEVMYLAKRIGYHTPYWWIARLIFGLVWVVPFAVLLGRKPKTMPIITTAIAYTIFTGLFLEYWLMIQPVVPVNWVLAVVEMVVLAFLFTSVMKSEDTLVPQAAPAPSAGTGLETAGQH
jgi:hypothetical protein